MKDKFVGFIRVFYPERSFGFIRNQRTAADTFFWRGDVQGDPNKIVEQARVEYYITDYQRKGKTDTKAIEVVILPAIEIKAPEKKVGEVLATPDPNAKPPVYRPNITGVLMVEAPAQKDFEWK